MSAFTVSFYINVILVLGANLSEGISFSSSGSFLHMYCIKYLWILYYIALFVAKQPLYVYIMNILQKEITNGIFLLDLCNCVKLKGSNVREK